jgi:hypothetical protein
MAKNHRNPSPNDQRSNVKNPNNPAYHQDQANRAAQLEANQSKPSAGSSSPRNA